MHKGFLLDQNQEACMVNTWQATWVRGKIPIGPPHKSHARLTHGVDDLSNDVGDKAKNLKLVT